jgi:hypothetical protein
VRDERRENNEGEMSRPRCVSCGDSWGESFPCRLTDEDNPEEWVQIYICSACWQSAVRQHEGRLCEQERRLLAAWTAPLEEHSA